MRRKGDVTTGGSRSRVILRISYVEDPGEVQKVVDILSRGRQRAVQRMLVEKAGPPAGDA